MTFSNTQKTLLLILAAVLLASLTVAAWGVAKWGFARSSRPDSTRGITVSDSAEVKVAPDTAFVALGVVTKDKNVKNAAKMNAEKTAAVVAAVSQAGIPKRDIKTVDYSLEPDMDWDKTPARIVGYTASNSVRIRTKNLAKIGDLIDAAVHAGANNVQGVSFDVEDKNALRQKALALAVKKAEGKAKAIADALGAKLGPALSASESVEFDYSWDRKRVTYRMKSPAVAQMKTPVEPGETTVSAQVKVVYSIQ